MGLFDPTTGARWARVLAQLDALQVLCAEIEKEARDG